MIVTFGGAGASHVTICLPKEVSIQMTLVGTILHEKIDTHNLPKLSTSSSLSNIMEDTRLVTNLRQQYFISAEDEQM